MHKNYRVVSSEKKSTWFTIPVSLSVKRVSFRLSEQSRDFLSTSGCRLFCAQHKIEKKKCKQTDPMHSFCAFDWIWQIATKRLQVVCITVANKVNQFMLTENKCLENFSGTHHYHNTHQCPRRVKVVIYGKYWRKKESYDYWACCQFHSELKKREKVQGHDLILPLN